MSKLKEKDPRFHGKGKIEDPRTLPEWGCMECGAEPERVDSKVVYGKSYGWMYRCPKCFAYVGCHKDTMIPLGFPANAATRKARKELHSTMDPLWQNSSNRRAQREWVYGLLGNRLGLKKSEQHVGRLSEAQCLIAIDYFKGRYEC